MYYQYNCFPYELELQNIIDIEYRYRYKYNYHMIVDTTTLITK